PDVLFRQYDVRATLDAQVPEIHKVIDTYPGDALVREPDDQLVAEFTERFRVDAPVLTEGAISVDAEEVRVDVSGDRNRDIRDRAGRSTYPEFRSPTTYRSPATRIC